MNIIITGFKGLLGSSLLEILKGENNITGVDLPEYDISDSVTVERIFESVSPDIVINCAAMTNVDLCEMERDKAYAANSKGPGILADICSEKGVRLIHYSTDYIFDGRKGLNNIFDIPDPLNYYGMSKLFGEFGILARRNLLFSIIRTNVLFGHKGNANFINWLNNCLKTGKSVRIVDDQYNNPCYIDDIVDFTLHIIKKDLFGSIYHTGSSDYMNRFDFSLKFAEIMNYDTRLISPVSTGEFKQKACRPLKGGLDILETERKTGFSFSRTEESFKKLKKIFESE